MGHQMYFFHMVKITEENLSKWEIFKQKLDTITPAAIVNVNPLKNTKYEHARVINIDAGLNDFKIKKSNTVSDLFVVYASKELNKTNLPPNWQDVEMMVTIIAKEGIPFITQMGIVKLAHTYTKEAFSNLIDMHTNTIKNAYNKVRINQELFDYLISINFNYPSHKYISLYVFAFIATRINSFYLSEKTALFTSPVHIVADIVGKLFNTHRLIYGYEEESTRDGQIKITLYNSENPFLILTRDNLKEECPWYCNIFEYQRSIPHDSANYDAEFPEALEWVSTENTPDCYSIERPMGPFLYIPIHSFNQLVERGVYQFDPIE